MLQQGRCIEAVERFQRAIQLKPTYVKAHRNLMVTLMQMGKVREAITAGNQADRQIPDQPKILSLLAWLLASHEPSDGGDPLRAVELAERAVRLTHGQDVVCVETLAAAYASAGRFEQATATAQEALRLAQAAGQTPLVARVEKQLQLYRNRTPYRKAPVTPSLVR